MRTKRTWMQEARAKKNLSQTKLAIAAGCSKTTIVKIENDSRDPSFDLALRIADILDIDIKRFKQ
jgi:DNA-binding XRE family transcriptional regulator